MLDAIPSVTLLGRPVEFRDDSGLPFCRHRATRWCCNQEQRIVCAIDRYEKGGIVERHQCEECQAGPVRVAFWVHELAGFGGTETWLRTLLRHLDPGRVEVIGVGSTNPGRIHEKTAKALGIPVVSGVDGMREQARRVEVIVASNLGDLSELLEESNRPRVIMACHLASEKAFDYNLKANPWVDQFACVGESARVTVPKGAHVAVIPNGVPMETARIGPHEQRQRWGVKPGSLVVGMVGRIAREKDPFALARAMAHLPLDWVGVHVGDGPEQDAVMHHAATTAPLRVYFPGPTDDVAAAYDALDCLLVASEAEGFGLVIAEAWRRHLPVISTAVGVAAEYPALVRTIPFGASGAALAEAIEDDYNNGDGWARTREAKRVADALFSVERMAKEWADRLWSLVRPSHH